MVMAYAFLKTLVGDHEVGRITMDYTTGRASASDGHAVLSSEVGAVTVESTRYPFCFFGKEGSVAGTLSSVDFTGFNEELNRFMLVVHNAPQRSVVTWGNQSKVFTAEALANGINLADEFKVGNPFADAFYAVLTAVRAKQTFETHMVKKYVNAVPLLERILPEDGDKVRGLVDALKQERDRQMRAAVDLVVPVKHSLRIRPAEPGDV